MNLTLKPKMKIKYLCETGMVKHKLKRKYGFDLTFLRCKRCKKDYDTEVLGTKICPRCKASLIHPKIWYRECKDCKEAF